MQLRQQQDVAGCTPGFTQPSVCTRLVGAAEPLHAQAVQRLHRLLAPVWKCKPPASDASTAAYWIGAAAVVLQRARGLPMFAEPRVQLEAGDSLVLRVPTLDGLHSHTRRLVAALIALAASAQGAQEDTGAGEAAAALRALDAALRALSAHSLTGKNRAPMLEAAHRAGIPWVYLGRQTFRLGHGVHSRWFDSSLTDRTPALAVALARDKFRCAALLRRQGLPVPDHHLVRTEDEAAAAAHTLGLPVVVKPADLDRGIGVRARLRTEAAVRAAYREARVHSANVLVERQIVGEDHRMHVFDGRVYRVRHRVPGGVSGDGVSTVRQLLDRLNADVQRGAPGSAADLVRIEIDADAQDMLDEQGLALEAVPAAGRFVALRSIANVSAGGRSLHVPIDEAHPDNLLLAERAVRVLRLDMAAVDLLIPDIRRSWMQTGAGICEVNAKPQFGADAPEHLFAALFPQQGRIPVVMVIGELEPGWFVVLREQAAAAGIVLGVSDTSGAWSGLRRIAPLPREGASRGAELLAGEPDVQALLVHADASLLRDGLPSDRIDLLILAAATAPPAHDALFRGLAPAARRLWLLAPGTGWAERRAELARRGSVELVPATLLPGLMSVLTSRPQP